MGLRNLIEFGKECGADHRVVIGKQYPLGPFIQRVLNRLVVPSGKSQILCTFHQLNRIAKLPPNFLDRVIIRSIIDDDNLIWFGARCKKRLYTFYCVIRQSPVYNDAGKLGT